MTYSSGINLHSSLIISYRSATNNIDLHAIFAREKLGNSPVLFHTLTNISRIRRRFYVHDETSKISSFLLNHQIAFVQLLRISRDIIFDRHTYPTPRLRHLRIEPTNCKSEECDWSTFLVTKIIP